MKLGHAQQAAGYLDAVVRSPERLGRQFGRYGISAGASIPITDEISAHIGPDLRGALLALVEARQALAQWDEAMQCLERLRRAEPEDVLLRSLWWSCCRRARPTISRCCAGSCA